VADKGVFIAATVPEDDGKAQDEEKDNGNEPNKNVHPVPKASNWSFHILYNIIRNILPSLSRSVAAWHSR
jgi:hypothetical protein